MFENKLFKKIKENWFFVALKTNQKGKEKLILRMYDLSFGFYLGIYSFGWIRINDWAIGGVLYTTNSIPLPRATFMPTKDSITTFLLPFLGFLPFHHFRHGLLRLLGIFRPRLIDGSVEVKIWRFELEKRIFQEGGRGTNKSPFGTEKKATKKNQIQNFPKQKLWI